mgnify:CR=1 FL=1
MASNLFLHKKRRKKDRNFITETKVDITKDHSLQKNQVIFTFQICHLCRLEKNRSLLFVCKLEKKNDR